MKEGWTEKKHILELPGGDLMSVEWKCLKEEKENAPMKLSLYINEPEVLFDLLMKEVLHLRVANTTRKHQLEEAQEAAKWFTERVHTLKAEIRSLKQQLRKAKRKKGGKK